MKRDDDTEITKEEWLTAMPDAYQSLSEEVLELVKLAWVQGCENGYEVAKNDRH